MDLEEIEYEYVKWIHVFQGKIEWRKLVNTAINLQVARL
jgi:hypothetical protein